MAEVVVNMGIEDLNKGLDKAQVAAENLELSKKVPPAVGGMVNTMQFMIVAIGRAKTGDDLQRDIAAHENPSEQKSNKL